jgi:glycosyltransferase involved in cell wall biosynthesis
MILSILICSLHNRKHLLERLMSVLNPQLVKGVEVLVELDGGELKTGTKRNILKKKAKGKYIVYVDDDDLVSNNYVALILNAAKLNPDVITFEGYMTTDGLNKKRFILGLEIKTWYEANNIYYRSPNHIVPIRKSCIENVWFPDKYVAEDADFSRQIVSLNCLKTSVHINSDLYIYDYKTKKQ